MTNLTGLQLATGTLAALQLLWAAQRCSLMRRRRLSPRDCCSWPTGVSPSQGRTAATSSRITWIAWGVPRDSRTISLALILWRASWSGTRSLQSETQATSSGRGLLCPGRRWETTSRGLAIHWRGCHPENIWNYDETNLSQNPGTVKAIFKRGIKYAEEVRDQSKNSISVMFCGSASGELMPPYVVYRGNYCYPTWGQGGAPGVHYGATPSGSVLVPVPTGYR